MRVRGEMLEEVERCCIEPLQIVEEERERMLRLGERAKESLEYRVEAVLRISRRQLGNRRLFPDDEFQLWDEANDEFAIRLNGRRQVVPPPAQLGITLDEDLTDQCSYGPR